MRILIDADGCPVVNIAIKKAAEYALECLILCDTSHHYEREGAKTLTFSKGADSVDFALVNMLQTGDIVITQDYGLAAMCLARRTVPIRQDGLVFNDENIDSLLLQRHSSKQLRMAGARSKAQPKRTELDDNNFELALDKLIVSLQEQLKC